MCFGPSKQASQIEASKAFAKTFMQQYSIPTARWMSFDDAHKASQHISTAKYDALVVKADGLAAGKGVLVAKNQSEAIEAVSSMLNVGFWSFKNTVIMYFRYCMICFMYC